MKLKFMASSKPNAFNARRKERCFISVGWYSPDEFDGGNSAFHSAHAIQVFVEFVLVVLGQCSAKVFGAADDEVEHLTIQRVRLADVSGPIGLSEEPVQDAARINLGGDGLGC